MLPPVITIDGPTASGKGTVALGIAQVLAWKFLDSGALYRLTALSLIKQGLSDEAVRGFDPSSPSPALEMLQQRAGEIAKSLNVRFDKSGTWLDDGLVTEEIRAEAVGMLASKISAWEPVRSGLLSLQRDFRQSPGLVADGRDMGTVIFPDAPLKVYLTATAEVRADRRYKQLMEKGISVKIEGLLDDLQRRDAQDMQRAIAPLKPAHDAVLLDTSNMNVAEAIDWVLKRWSLLQLD